MEEQRIFQETSLSIDLKRKINEIKNMGRLNQKAILVTLNFSFCEVTSIIIKNTIFLNTSIQLWKKNCRKV
jgi:hypothetical protein